MEVIYIVPKKCEQINDYEYMNSSYACTTVLYSVTLFNLHAVMCLEAEASRRGSLEAARVLPRARLNVLMHRLSLA